MKILGWTVIFFLGISVLNVIAFRIKTLEKIGFALPLGMGINSVLMFMMNLFHIPANQIHIILGVEVAIIIAFSFYAHHKNKPITIGLLPGKFNYKKLFSINLAWVFLMFNSIYVIYIIVYK